MYLHKQGLLLAAALEVAGKVFLVTPSVSKGSSNAPIPSIFLIIIYTINEYFPPFTE